VKGKMFEKFASRFIIPEWPGFTVSGNLIYRIPVATIFKGFVFDSSGFSADVFNPTVFVQPLYVPQDYITLTLGQRLLGNWEFSPEVEEEALASRLLRSMTTEGMPLLDLLATPEKIAKEAEKLNGAINSHSVRRVVAYSLVWIGEDNEALQRLDKLLLMLEEMGKGVQKWALHLHEEVSQLREALLRNPNEARTLLAMWTEQTRQKLKLPQ
jgi:hypothetical protein